MNEDQSYWFGRAYVKAIKGINWRGQEHVTAYEVIRDSEQLAFYEISKSRSWRVALHLANLYRDDANEQKEVVIHV
jgi:hypothetical protein